MPSFKKGIYRPDDNKDCGYVNLFQLVASGNRCSGGRTLERSNMLWEFRAKIRKVDDYVHTIILNLQFEENLPVDLWYSYKSLYSSR